MGKATVLYSQHLLDSQSFEFLICILQALNVPLIHCTNIFFPNEAIPSHMYLALQVAGFPFTDILYGSKHTEELFFRNKLFLCDLYQTKLLSKLLSGIISIFILTGLDLVKSAIGCTREEDFFWEKIFTDKDVDTSSQKYKQSLAEKRKTLHPSSMYTYGNACEMVYILHTVYSVISFDWPVTSCDNCFINIGRGVSTTVA